MEKNGILYRADGFRHGGYVVQPGVELEINLLPEVDLVRALEERKQQHPHCRVKSVLADYLPKRLVAALVRGDLAERPLSRPVCGARA